MRSWNFKLSTKKTSHCKYKVQTQSCNGMVPKTCLGSLDHTSLSLSKKPRKKKRLKSCLQSLVKLGKTMQQPFPCKQNEKDWEVANSPRAQRNPIEMLFELTKMQANNYVVTFAHLLNCTCYAHTHTYLPQDQTCLSLICCQQKQCV